MYSVQFFHGSISGDGRRSTELALELAEGVGVSEPLLDLDLEILDIIARSSKVVGGEVFVKDGDVDAIRSTSDAELGRGIVSLLNRPLGLFSSFPAPVKKQNLQISRLDSVEFQLKIKLTCSIIPYTCHSLQPPCPTRLVDPKDQVKVESKKASWSSL